MKVICPYCEKDAALVSGGIIYPDREDLHAKMYWWCEDCGAWVGTHEDSKEHKPYGTLANEDLRLWRRRAHLAFDPLWEAKVEREGCSKGKARQAGYRWLAGEIGITEKQCHTGMFTVEQCQRTVQICMEVKRKIKHGIKGGT